MPVRTRNIAFFRKAVTVPPWNVPVATTPAGEIWFIRELCVTNLGANGSFVVSIQRGAISPVVLQITNLGALSTIVSPGRFIVMEAGDSLNFGGITGTTGDIFASGAKLLL